MGDLTHNLSRHEFACQCGCGFAVADFETVSILQETADHYMAALKARVEIIITSGCRCLEHNETVQKEYDPDYVPYSSASKHMTLGAVDYKMFFYNAGERVQIPPRQIHNYLDHKYPTRLGLGVYKNRNHIDPRSKKARWNNT